MEDFPSLVNLVNETLFDEKRPKYILVLGNYEDGKKLSTGITVNARLSQEYIVNFYKISPNVYYTYCHGSHQVISHALASEFGHNKFFLAEIFGYLR